MKILKDYKKVLTSLGKKLEKYKRLNGVPTRLLKPCKIDAVSYLLFDVTNPALRPLQGKGSVLTVWVYERGILLRSRYFVPTLTYAKMKKIGKATKKFHKKWK